MDQKPQRIGPLWVALPALVGAVAGLALPSASTTPSAVAALLAVGALALLAGHTWGLLLILGAHTVLVGHAWPALVHLGAGSAGPGGGLGVVAISVVIVTALPSMTLATSLLPTLARLVLPQGSRRAHALLVATISGLLAVSLIAPALA